MTIPEPRITGPKTPLSRLGQRRDPLLAHLAHGPLQKLDPAGKPFRAARPRCGSGGSIAP